MSLTETGISGLIVIEPKVLQDDRGYFFESYNRKNFSAAGIDAEFVQDNQAKSSYGVLRGLHYQVEPFAQAKLVRVISGEVLDVVVDLRPGSETFGQWFSIRLNAENKKQLFIPRGFAHGYLVLSPTAEFSYKCDNFYSPAHEGGLRFDDPEVKIDWEIDPGHIILSEKDQNQPNLRQHRRFNAMVG